jgi:hypothetical protein
MKKYTQISPVGLKGNEINERMKELMGIKPINENYSKSVVELTKLGPDGKAYAIVRENHEWYIKSSNKSNGLVVEDFKYIGGLQNKKSEAYPSYAKAIKHLNLKFRSLAEAHNFDGEINVFENDNLLSESGIAGFSNMSGNGFSGEGNLEGNKALYEEDKSKNNPWAICTASVGREDKEKYEACVRDVKKENGIDESITENEYCGDDVELSEVEKAVETMNEENSYAGKSNCCDVAVYGETDICPKCKEHCEVVKDEKKEISESNKLSISRALNQMDSIIDNLTEGVVKKKVYTIK